MPQAHVTIELCSNQSGLVRFPLGSSSLAASTKVPSLTGTIPEHHVRTLLGPEEIRTYQVHLSTEKDT